jgi:hypothetical protein
MFNRVLGTRPNVSNTPITSAISAQALRQGADLLGGAQRTRIRLRGVEALARKLGALKSVGASRMTDNDDFRAPDFELKLRDRLQHGDNVTVLHCTQCRERIRRESPLNIVITDPVVFEMPDAIERQFCSWECAADWFAVQAGRKAPRSISDAG